MVLYSMRDQEARKAWKRHRRGITSTRNNMLSKAKARSINEIINNIE